MAPVLLGHVSRAAVEHPSTESPSPLLPNRDQPALLVTDILPLPSPPSW
jgi:hypothetical protein